ncbi:MAG: hypothetical protein P8Y58_06580 [Novosphingobium sp.]
MASGNLTTLRSIPCLAAACSVRSPVRLGHGSRELAGNHTAIAGRIAGAFRNLGYDRFADGILGTMRAAGHVVRESDPFQQRLAPMERQRETSPYVHRIRLLWAKIREDIVGRFPPPPRQNDIDAYIQAVDDIYVTDAYHSLSIEGYRVSRELIERVRSGSWNPESDEADRAHRDALAARGYWQAFNVVKDSLTRVLGGDNPGTVADRDHGIWYRELFGPSVAAGLLKATDLAGYRSGPVYIRRSRHVPLSAEAVRDAMPTLYQGAKRLTHAGDSQAAEILILECKHMEACGGSSDRCSI